MDPILEFFGLILLFGPAVAIPFASGFLAITEIFVVLLAVQVVAMLPIFELFDLLRYSDRYENKLLNDFSALTGRQMDSVRKNAKLILQGFHQARGHLGYQIAVVFCSFALGFGWAIVLAYALKLRKLDAFLTVLAGSALSFIFWYLALLMSAPFISAQMFMMLAMGLAVVFMVYGRFRHKAVLVRVGSSLPGTDDGSDIDTKSGPSQSRGSGL